MCLSFSGHRRISAQEQIILEQRLTCAIEHYYMLGKRVFLAGGAIGFDTIAAETVLYLRTVHPDMILLLALPCQQHFSRWSQADQAKYQNIKNSADRIVYVSEEYFPGCMQKRNQYLIDHSDTCICYLNYCRGGTWNTVSYAYDLGRTIINLATER